MARRLWVLTAVAGILLGALLLITGDRFGYHGVRLRGAASLQLSTAGRISADAPGTC